MGYTDNPPTTLLYVSCKSSVYDIIHMSWTLNCLSLYYYYSLYKRWTQLPVLHTSQSGNVGFTAGSTREQYCDNRNMGSLSHTKADQCQTCGETPQKPWVQGLKTDWYCLFSGWCPSNQGYYNYFWISGYRYYCITTAQCKTLAGSFMYINTPHLVQWRH